MPRDCSRACVCACVCVLGVGVGGRFIHFELGFLRRPSDKWRSETGLISDPRTHQDDHVPALVDGDGEGPRVRLFGLCSFVYVGERASCRITRPEPPRPDPGPPIFASPSAPTIVNKQINKPTFISRPVVHPSAKCHPGNSPGWARRGRRPSAGSSKMSAMYSQARATRA